MWRSLFLAVGFSFVLLGVEAMAIDKAVLKVTRPAAGQNSTYSAEAQSEIVEIVPAQWTWAPWSLVSAGAVVILYSFSIPKRIKE
jgi:hypothetical protein